MKKATIITFLYAIILLALICAIIIIPSFYSNLEAATTVQDEQYNLLEQKYDTLNLQLESLSSSLQSYEKSLNELDKRLMVLEENNNALHNLLIEFYIEKMKDPTYVSIYNNDYTYYTAAEALGQIGKPAIPKLIDRLNTTDDYERALVLYALLLASQADNVKSFCGDDYIHTNLDFDARNHPSQIQLVQTWWEKYKSYF